MEISVIVNHGFELIIENDNAKIIEDIEERTYHLDENGKSDFTRQPKRDVKTEIIDQFGDALEDMIFYRKEKYDSFNLIETLITKLPSEKLDVLRFNLLNNYN